MGGRLKKGGLHQPPFSFGSRVSAGSVELGCHVPRGRVQEWLFRAGYAACPFLLAKKVSRRGVPAARAWGWRATLKFQEATITNRDKFG